ncbi:LacI family DNA-binding transcriptional regulator [Dactylosporangium sp. NPDC049140]|uniref:LacI family DNA-binding transcriptional regulator n=1 Tax=Dactylosporangium sp. NPDC049140 TaxID=3155647 RepID=UPI0033D54DFD
MGFGEKRDGYWRARYKLAPGKYGTVKDEAGATVRFRTKREAKQAADAAEAQVRAGAHRPVTAGRMTFGAYVNRWFAQQDLASSTMQTYRSHIEAHLLPAFELATLPTETDDGSALSKAGITAWERAERAAGYPDGTVKAWRKLLHLILSDAVDEGCATVNPAARRRGRGRVAGRARHRAPEKAVTTALGVLLIAERAALLSGRDDEFVGVTAMGFSGLRWGETVGLEPEYVRGEAVRVEWQLYELDNGTFERCPPKDDSYRTVAAPDFLTTLLTGQVTRNEPAACACHGRRYVFSGHRPPRAAIRQQGPRVVDVARRAGVSTGTVSAVLNGRDTAAAATRLRVEQAIADLGYVRGAVDGPTAPHWRRGGFATWLFQPAATGRFPAKAPQPERPVPLLAEPWPGVPLRGRNAAGRAECCWAPIAPGLTPHGLRHTYKTMMMELGTSPKLMDAQMGHADGSVSALYEHVTKAMVRRLLDGLTEIWRDALAERRRLYPGSPVRVLDGLLREES